ncbi:MAG: hypothetical protein M0037_09725 [Betaproteobacteria bacterium]|nr:hypothetical protein [Betaproteobacteria bacterium]
MTNDEDQLPADLERLWRTGRLDAVCPACGAVMAASGWCYRCGTELSVADYVPHAGRGRGACLAARRNGPNVATDSAAGSEEPNALDDGAAGVLEPPDVTCEAA